MVLQYVNKVGGGSFTCTIDGILQGPCTSTAISTSCSSGCPTLGTLDTTSLPAGQHIVAISIASQESSGVTITGADVILAGNGVRFEKLGTGGATMAEYNSIWSTYPSTYACSSLTQLHPDAVAIMFMANERSANESLLTFQSDLVTAFNNITALLSG